MSGEQDQIEAYQCIKQYLKYWQLNVSLESLQEQLSKKVIKKGAKKSVETKLQHILKVPSSKSKAEVQMQKENRIQIKKYHEVLQSGRQIFSVAINLLQIIHNIKDGGSKYDHLNETIENYKIQLGKHNKTIINEGRVQGTELISENVIKEHKAKLQQHFQEKYIDGIIEILLSLRVNALQIAPELRKSLVEQLIRRDIFKITQNQNFDFLLQVLKIKNKSLRHAITSLISVIVSTISGIDYITYDGNSTVLQKIIQILKQQENGNVTQRFCLAILQKCSVKNKLIDVYLQMDMISWVLSMVKKSFNSKIHMFCLDFSTAMLANIVHSNTCQTYFQRKPEVISHLMETLLKYIKEPLEVSVLMHLLITISYLCKEKFKKQMEEHNTPKKIKEFIEFYERIAEDDGQAAEMDKRTVLDLCTHMFHGKEDDQDTQERIREYENEQGELIFECFQDQVN